MAQTLVSLLVHVVFSTKNRKNVIPEDAKSEDRLSAFIGGIVRSRGSRLLAAGCTQNHIHLLISLSKNESLSETVREVKKRSSQWIKTTDASCRDFQWQEGYGAFSVGASQVSVVRAYVKNQKTHHRSRSFEDEYLALLDRYEIEYDPQYVWG